MPGKLHPKGAMLLRQEIGSGKNSAGRVIKLFSAPDGPGVEDVASGRYWTLGWADIVALAMAEFDKPTEETPNDPPSL